MSVTRRALLICNPGEEGAENYCKGVFVDVANYRRMFREPHGGWWNDGDILRMTRPSVSEVKVAVRSLADYDYTFIAFSGHGWYSSIERDTILELRKGENLPSAALLQDAWKRTVILDCCREVYHEPATAAMMRKYAAVMESTKRQANPERCRDKFLRDVETSTRGVITVHSCALNETAGDSEQFGGRYTAGLISAGDRWADEESKNTGYSAKSLSVVAAHEIAAEETRRRSGGTQNPSIDKPRTEKNYFPFAVFAT